MSKLWVIFLLLPICTLTAPSQRSKCALECFSRCMQSGTPSAVYCNCPVEKTLRSCSSVEQKLSNAELLASVPEATTEYIDSHTIRIQMDEHPIAFAYIFEYSTISTYPDEWYFAGSSMKPTITFSVLDPCRDYQFRVIVVIRSTNPEEEFVIYRPRAIQVKLPPFALTTDEIIVENPTVNTSSNMLKVYVRWSLPRGYSDGDIHGYEAPALYPMQCRTPEEELPQPKIEIIRGGGRLAVSLPATVLEARCRLWVEVKMLPRCVRLEPFSIQKSVDIDCDKRPDMEICSREANPVCTEKISISGSKGKPQLTWESPTAKEPLYYHVRYGLAHLKGSPPFTTWQLISKRDVKVDGAVSTIDIEIPLDKEYGVQVCAILSNRRKRPKFGVVPVIAFQCDNCKNETAVCKACYKLDVPPLGSRWNMTALATASEDEAPTEKSTQQQAVFQMETDLMVAAPATIRNLSQIMLDKKIPQKRPSFDDPKQQTSVLLDSDPTTASTLLDTTVISTTIQSTTELPTKIEPKLQMTTTIKPTTAITTTTTTTITTTSISVSDENMKLKHQPESPDNLVEKEQTVKSEETNTESPEKQKEHFDFTEELKESVRNLEVVLAEEIGKNQSIFSDIFNDNILGINGLSDVNKASNSSNNTSKDGLSVEGSQAMLSSKVIDEPMRSRVEARGTKLLTAQSAISREASTVKCLLSNGIVCEFGCESKTMCICPVTHSQLSSGACVSMRKKEVSCLRKRDLNATWDPITKNILIYSNEAYEHIRSMDHADRLYVEFGKIREEKLSLGSSNETIGGFVFDNQETHKMVVGTEKLIRTSVFSEEPFIFHVKETIDIDNFIYGMRLCTFKNRIIQNPFAHNWNEENSVNKSGSIVQVTQLSAIRFTNDLKSDFIDNYWLVLYNVGKITLLIVLAVLIMILIYLNCSRIKSLYDRKRTHYFRPYYFDPQVHVTQSSRYGLDQSNRGLHRTENSIYDNRSRMI